jgi:ATP synthase subunit 6
MRFEDSLFRFDIDITLCFFFTLIAFFFSVISVHFNEISGNFLIKNNIEFFTLKFLIFFWQLFRSNFSNKVLNNLYNIFFIVFFFILLSNILGLIPFSYTITSHLVITFSLSSSLFIGLNINGILKHGLHFFTLFVPKGVSGVLIPFLVVIELISYIARVFSLAIRLFANLMAGHALTTIVNSFIWLLLLYSPLGFLNAFILFIAVYAIGNLEAVIALLQAYVFIMLISLYYQDVLTLH